MVPLRHGKEAFLKESSNCFCGMLSSEGNCERTDLLTVRYRIIIGCEPLMGGGFCKRHFISIF